MDYTEIDVNIEVNAVCFGILCNFTPVCGKERAKEAADLVHEIYEERKSLMTRVEAAEARAEKAENERDAAVSDLRGCAIESCAECMYCLYRTAKSFCWNCTDGSNWKWKGQKEE